MQDRAVSETETDKERIDRELRELLDEVRIALPGAEVLFAFLLAVAFTERFDTITSLQKAVYFGVLLLTATAMALLMSPAAYHRLRFRAGDKQDLLRSSSRLAVASLVLLMLAVTGSVYLVGAVIYGSVVAGVAAGGICGWFVGFWFLLPLSRRLNDR